METIGDRLRRLRTLKKLTQAQLAAIAGVGQSTINSIENGARNKMPSSLIEIAHALGVDAYWLKTGKSENRYPNWQNESDIRDILAANIDARKTELGISSQKDLAAKTKGAVAQTTISLICRSATDKTLPWPKLDTLSRLADALETSVSSLLSDPSSREQESPVSGIPYEISALVEAVQRLTPDEAKKLFPVVVLISRKGSDSN